MLTPNRAFPVPEKLTGVISQTVAIVSTMLPVDIDTPINYLVCTSGNESQYEQNCSQEQTV